MRLIDADKLKKHYAWWGSENASDELKEWKKNFDDIIDVQPTVEKEENGHEEISEIKRSLSEIEMRQIHLVNSYAALLDCCKKLSASYKETVDTIKEIAGWSNEATKSARLIAEVLKEMAEDKLKSAVPIRHGHWIVSGLYDDFLKCSECGFTTPMWSVAEEKWAGCPVCLAKMDGDEQIKQLQKQIEEIKEEKK